MRTCVTVYIAGPFRADPEGNKLRFAEANLELWKRGFFGFDPVANCYPMRGRFTEDDFAERGVKALRKLKFDAMLMLPGWEDSAGAKAERQVAMEYGIPVFDSVEALRCCFPGVDGGE
jgi:hypothetical protein